MVVFLIASLGVYNSIIYSVTYNAGNNSRSQALVVLQQEVELLRSAKFTPEVMNESLNGGTRIPKIINAADGSRFIVQTEIDDDPLTSGIQVNNNTTLKELTITVSMDTPTPGWQTAVPTTVVLQRVRAN
jgi:lipoprotein-anchoring transpeptidase ErfK/SrfK